MVTMHSPKLASSELAMLWSGYIQNTMSTCILKYFLSTVEDQDIKPVIEFACNTSEQNALQIKSILEAEKVPVPYGFSDSDVNLDAPRLYSDPFFCRYV
jgi:hypothetical protein